MWTHHNPSVDGGYTVYLITASLAGRQFKFSSENYEIVSLHIARAWICASSRENINSAKLLGFLGAEYIKPRCRPRSVPAVEA